MKVILKQDVDNLGDAGEIVDVADGYGNNFLVPRGLAMRATKGVIADAQAIARARGKREARDVAEANERKAALEAGPVTIAAKAGEDGTLYGSVGNSAVARAINEQLGVRIDRRRIPMDRPLKNTGAHEVSVRIHGNVQANVRVEVVEGE
jgi:large subunit ribosomal protein L9